MKKLMIIILLVFILSGCAQQKETMDLGDFLYRVTAPDGHGIIRSYNIETGESSTVMEFAEPIFDFYISNDKQFLAVQVVSAKPLISIYDLHLGKVINQLKGAILVGMSPKNQVTYYEAGRVSTPIIKLFDIKLHKIKEIGKLSGDLSWSPKGDRLVYTKFGFKHRLFIKNIITKEEKELLPSEGSDNQMHPNWSPKGDQIVFISNRSGGYKVYSIKPNGNQLREIANGIDGGQPKISYDGKTILVNAFNANGSSQLELVSLDGTEQRVLLKSERPMFYVWVKDY